MRAGLCARVTGLCVWRRPPTAVNRYWTDLELTAAASPGGRLFTVCDGPTRGPFYGTTSLVSRASKKLWNMPYRDPQAAVSPDNRFVLMRAGPATPRVHPDSDPPVEWRVADWKGRELPRNGKGESARFVAPGGIVLTVKNMNWTATRGGRILWKMRTEFKDPRLGCGSWKGCTNRRSHEPLSH